jgi:short subunit dehydrogenase-like uncharacterized protein
MTTRRRAKSSAKPHKAEADAAPTPAPVPPPPEWMIYGANGYTGRMILEEAVRRGHRPIVAGRNASAVHALASLHGLPARAFDLAHPATARAGLSGVGVVLHCAGPFSATCAPMLEACLSTGTHYLDITGEIEVFAHCHARHPQALERGIVVMPGAGFDVVPTDCLAAMLAAELPQATSLVLAFEAEGGPSPGTAKTSVEGLARGGCVRRDGVLTPVPLGWKSRSFDRDGVPRSAMTIPWGDVYTAFVTTGIPDIEVYMAMPPKTIARAQRLRRLQPLLALGFVQRFLKARVHSAVSGPSAGTRAQTGCVVWGEARDAHGNQRHAQLHTPNGYDVTTWAALGIVERLLGDPAPRGYFTPSQLMGADYILRMPGVRRIDPEPAR